MIDSKYMNTAFFGVLALFVIFLGFLTYDPGLQTENALLQFLVDNHRILMLVMVLLTGVFGYYMNKELRGEIVLQEQENKEVLGLLLQTQGSTERQLLQHLIQQGPKTQAQLSKLSGMTRVKVHRGIQKLQGQGLVIVESKGKTRMIIPSQALRSKPY